MEIIAPVQKRLDFLYGQPQKYLDQGKLHMADAMSDLFIFSELLYEEIAFR
jgi:hypothetical protein